MTMRVQLGQRYRDTITDYEGTATVRSEYLHGTTRVCLEAPDDKGAPVEYWFDEPRLVEVATDRIPARAHGYRLPPRDTR